MKIGVLAIQGDFAEHIGMLKRLGVETTEVRLPAQLAGLDGLIIPGGESTTIGKLAVDYQLLEPLRKFGETHAMWGTCAGAIFLSKDARRSQPLLGIMDITVERNAFGRQVNSFEADLDIPELGEGGPYHAIFIRAPIIESVQGSASVLTTLPDGRIIAARQGQMLATSFHPELTQGCPVPPVFSIFNKMTVRSLDFLDLPLLARSRRDFLPLYSARMLTRGSPLGARAMLSYLNPRRYIYTGVASQEGDSLMGQVILKSNETSARLTFLAPTESISHLTLPLLDHLTMQAGEWGAFHLLAEVDENSPFFRSLRQAGFAMYAWQRVWKLPVMDPPDENSTWREVEETDWPAVQSLYGQIIPGLIQPVDALPKQATGMICRPEGNLQAYAAIDSGPAGVWIQPLVPPDSGCGPERLAGLSDWGGRPVYICVRSYQAWLETVLEDMGAEPGPRQAVMVRRLAKLQLVEEKVSAMDKVLVKPIAPVARVLNGEDKPYQAGAKTNEP